MIATATPDDTHTEHQSRSKAITLLPEEEAPLLWFFGPGQTIAERSVAGAMVERHGIYNRDVILEESAERVKRGESPLEYGTPGKVPIYEYGELTGYEDTRSPVFGSKGQVIGYSDPETVEITAELILSAGHEPQHEDMTRWADISRVLLTYVSQPLGTRYRDIFAEFYGNAGNQFNALEQAAKDPSASGQDRAFRGHGRIAALYRYTPAGERLLAWTEELRHGRGQPPSTLSVQERMEQEIRDTEPMRGKGAGSWKKPGRGKYVSLTESEERTIRVQMIAKARSESQPELWAACASWRDVWRRHEAATEARRREAKQRRAAGRSAA